MAEQTGGSACTTTPFYFPSRLLHSLCLYNPAMILLSHLRLMRGQAMERRPTLRPCAQEQSPSLPECLSTFHSAPSHLSTEASRRTSPTGPTLYGRAWYFRRLRGEITCKCLVTVPASFPSENVLIYGPPKTLFTSANGSFLPRTLPCSRTLDWTWFPFPDHASTVETWRNRFRYFALLEILTYSNDHSFQ
jgi:hypothetical protein